MIVQETVDHSLVELEVTRPANLVRRNRRIIDPPRARIGDEVRAQLLQQRTQIDNEAQERVADSHLVAILVSLEPVAIVVRREIDKEAEEVWT